MIYICIPAHDEARTVGVLLWRLRRVMTEFGRDFHLLVLDDGSTDETAEVLGPYARVLPLTVLRNERPAGYAAAVERLVRQAVEMSTHPRRDAVVVLQGDFTESPDDVPAMIKRLEGGADVVGSRVAGAEGELSRGLRWTRAGLPWLMKRAGVPADSGDPFSGFRAYRVHVLRRALQEAGDAPLLTRDGWAANAELLLKVAPHVRRAETADVSLRYTRRERPSRFRPWPTVREAWDLARRAPRRPRPEPAAAPAAPEPRTESAEPRPERTAERSRRPDRQPRPERQDAGARPQRSARRDASDRQDRQDRGRKRPESTEAATTAGANDSSPATAWSEAPAEAAVRDPSAEAARDPSAEAMTDAPAPKPRRPRRPRPPRRRPEQAEGAPAADAAEASDASPGEEASGEGSGGQPRKRPRRPRRRPRSAEGASAAAGEGDGGGTEASAGPAPEGESKPRRPRGRRPRRRGGAPKDGDATEGSGAPGPGEP